MSVTLEQPFPKGFELEFHPLAPGEFSDYEANAMIVELAAHGFVAARGIHRTQSGNLTAIARDPKVEEYCPNDAQTRFANPQVQRNWVRKNTGRAAMGIYHVDSLRGAVDVDDLPYVMVYDVTEVAHGWGGKKPTPI